MRSADWLVEFRLARPAHPRSVPRAARLAAARFAVALGQARPTARPRLQKGRLSQQPFPS